MKKQLYWYIGASIILTALGVLIYVISFWNKGLSSNPQDWTTFAEYISGITGPVLAVFNLLVLVQLTLSISDLDNQRLLTELRFESYKDFVARINEINSEKYSHQTIDSLSSYLKTSSLNNLFLLEGEKHKMFMNIHLEFYSLICDLEFALEELQKCKSENFLDINFPNSLRNNPNYIKEINDDIENYLRYYDGLKINYASFLQKVVSHRNIKEFEKKYLTENFKVEKIWKRTVK